MATPIRTAEPFAARGTEAGPAVDRPSRGSAQPPTAIVTASAVGLSVLLVVPRLAPSGDRWPADGSFPLASLAFRASGGDRPVRAGSARRGRTPGRYQQRLLPGIQAPQPATIFGAADPQLFQPARLLRRATVAMRIGGDGVTWLMSGLHGSTQLAVDDTTGKVSRERYLPFGQRRGDDDLPFTDHGFLGKVEDEATGLDYLSARYYDPTIARFISTDPLLDLRKPQWANPFAYAGNNPVGMSDPSGLESMAPSGAGYCDKECQKKNLQAQQRRAKKVAAAAEKERKRLQGLLARYTGQCRFNMLNPDCEYARRELIAYLGYDPNAQSEGAKRATAMFNAVMDFLTEDIVGCANGSLASCALFAANFIPGEKLAAGFGKLAAKAAEKLGPKLGKVAEKVAAGIKGKVPCNSFVPGTLILMADGSYTPIERVGVGDLVLAADPVSGKTEVRPVIAVIVGEGDKDLVEISVDAGGRDSQNGVVVATSEHPFWVQDQAHWLNAKDLAPGMHLRDPEGIELDVVAVHAYRRTDQRVYNLTVEGIHTYHVAFGKTAALVHNCDWEKISEIVRDAAKGKGNFNLGTGTMAEALAAGRAWVGDNYRVTTGTNGVKIWISADGLRQFRLPSFKSKWNNYQANFEWRLKPDGDWQGNGHLHIVE